jgi:hypothetical protein
MERDVMPLGKFDGADQTLDNNNPPDNFEQKKDEIEELERTVIKDLNDEESNIEYFKLGNPVFLQELDWAITFSKYDFPWRDITFNGFSPKDCYIKYT